MLHVSVVVACSPGVTTRQNRLDEIVPLRYAYVHQLKRELPHLHVEINGGGTPSC